MDERIVITGTGAITPLGHSVDETWQAVLNGVSGVGPITLFDSSPYPVHYACEVKNFKPENYMEAKEARRRDRFEQFAAVAALEAIRQSELDMSQEDPYRVGVVIAAALGGLRTIEEGTNFLFKGEFRRISPFVVPMLMPNGAAGLVSIDHGTRGPCMSVASACASGADGIGMAWMLIKAGVIDVAIAGASDAVITHLTMVAFERTGIFSKRGDDYSMSPQPFDLNRDGLVVGEGSAVIVLERESHARRRGAPILAELAGYASSSDAHHVTAPIDDASGAIYAMRQALASGRVDPSEVGYINAHGTATQLNDVTETRAIKAVFGERAYQIPISSTKSMTGHMMGTTGALELIFCTLAMRQGILPPTMHYQTPDPECDLDYIPNQAREKKVEVAMSNAFGFGGHNAVLILHAYP